ncbi:hypothetical protein RJ640_009736 [Escallonia rubra]|uniref:Uncharacterized protein n=1 Tax=Escallonia rubra TaxID=112253 RepID=A0AA88UQV6_9ASTE|nr:hypothetical protein RJ640_009736 [Escallonia rubra]
MESSNSRFEKTHQAFLLLSQMPVDRVGENIETEKLYEAVDFLLSLQSGNGGFAAWEPATSPVWLEVYSFPSNSKLDKILNMNFLFNSSEVFANAFVEHEYVECTASVVQALVAFKHLYPRYRENNIEMSAERAIDYIEKNQNPDGTVIGAYVTSMPHGLRWERLELLGGHF